jgi:UDP-glucuronate 4-epimerase
MKIIVTGVAGFIGSNLARSLVKSGNEVIGIDNFNDYYVEQCGHEYSGVKENNVKDLDIELHSVDITNPRLLGSIIPEADALVHLAARAGVRASLENPELYRQVNEYGTLNVLNAAIDKGIDNFVIASSSSVYGKRTDDGSFSENDSAIGKWAKAESPYAQTKQNMEEICKQFHDDRRGEIRMSIFRPFTVYGPNGRPDMAPHKFVKRIMNGEAIDKYGDGTSMRDYTYISDIVNGIEKMLSKDYPEFSVFNLGNNKPISLNQFIEIIEDKTGKTANINQMGPQEGDVPKTYADISKAKAYLGWEPKVDIRDGIASVVDYMRQQH